MDVRKQISTMRIEHQNGKLRHEKWVGENQQMVGSKEYEDYIEQFRIWEEDMLGKIEKLNQQIRRRPIEESPQLPGQDLDGQLYAMLENIPKKKFTTAFVKLCKGDPSVFGILTEIVNSQTKGTGYHNSLLPNANHQGIPIIPAFPPMIQLPNMNHAPPLISTSYIPYNAPSTSIMNMQSVLPPQAYQTPYAQSTPYGMIPSDWTIDEPVKRKKPQTPPPRQYTIKMPFKDFTQS